MKVIMAIENSFKDREIKIFTSYSTTDKEVAGRLKNELESFGFGVFLAHEDIEPCAEWETVILKSLEESDILMALLTEDYKKSDWADQEMGFAVANKKKVIPIQIDIIPYGFVKKIQSLKMNPQRIPYNITSTALEVFKVVQRDEYFKDKLLDSLIKAFEKSWSFEDAAQKSELLSTFDIFTNEQIENIVLAAIQNRCINQSFKGRKILKPFLLKYKEQIQPKYLPDLKKYYEV